MSVKKKSNQTAAAAAVKSLGKRPTGSPETIGSPAAHKKITVSLFPADLEAADLIRELLRKHCSPEANRSDAFKMALRMAASVANPRNVKPHFAAIKQEDGRARNKV